MEKTEGSIFFFWTENKGASKSENTVKLEEHKHRKEF